MRTVRYDPAMFRRWHDGPIVVLDCEGVGMAIDVHSAKYVAAASLADAAVYLNMLSRPFAGTIYVFSTEGHVRLLSAEFADLDIVHVTV